MLKVVGLAFWGTMFMVRACNTVEGMGKDVSSAGDTVAGTADDAKYGVCPKSDSAMLNPISGASPLPPPSQYNVMGDGARAGAASTQVDQKIRKARLLCRGRAVAR